MKQYTFWLIASLLLVLQYGHADTTSGYGRFYDPDHIETVQGTVLQVMPQERSSYHTRYGMRLRLNTSHGEIWVDVGPNWFLERQSMRIAAGDQLEITGSDVTIDGLHVLIAAEVRKSNQILKLRSKMDGTPLWQAQLEGPD